MSNESQMLCSDARMSNANSTVFLTCGNNENLARFNTNYGKFKHQSVLNLSEMLWFDSCQTSILQNTVGVGHILVATRLKYFLVAKFFLGGVYDFFGLRIV